MKTNTVLYEMRKMLGSASSSSALLCSFSFYKALTIIIFVDAFLFTDYQQEGLFSADPQAIFFILCAIICIIVAVFLRKNDFLFAQNWYAGLLLLLIMFGLLFLFLRINGNIQDYFSQNLCFSLGIILLGLGFTGFHIELGRVFGYLGMSKTLVFGILSSCIGALLYLITLLISGPLRWMIIVLYAIIAISFFYYIRNVLGKDQIYDHTYERNLQVPYKFMITSLIQGLTFGLLYGAFALSNYPLWPQIEVIGFFGAAILTLLTLLVAHIDFNRAIYRIGFPLIAIGMLLSGFFFENFLPFSPWVVLQVMGFLYLDLVLWALGSYLIKDRNQPATWVAACPSAMLMTGRAIGILAGSFVSDSNQQIVLFVGAFAIIFSALLLSSERNIKTGWGFIRPGDPQFSTDLVNTCSIISKEFRLTQRECEVLTSLAEGQDAEEIAKILYISQNTVKSHIQNIYNKLDVHSRKELLRIIANRQKLFKSHSDD